MATRTSPTPATARHRQPERYNLPAPSSLDASQVRTEADAVRVLADLRRRDQQLDQELEALRKTRRDLDARLRALEEWQAEDAARKAAEEDGQDTEELRRWDPLAGVAFNEADFHRFALEQRIDLRDPLAVSAGIERHSLMCKPDRAHQFSEAEQARQQARRLDPLADVDPRDFEIYMRENGTGSGVHSHLEASNLVERFAMERRGRR